MRVLITGAAGFVGRALVDACMRDGADVETLDVPGTGCNYSVDLDAQPENLLLGCGQEWDIVICNAKCRSWEAHDALARRARRCIVNVASIYGVVGPDPALYEHTEVPVTPAWYAAAKGAMIALTRHQACTLAPVRSNAVVLGGIERDHSAEFRRRYENKVPLRRMATEQDAVEAIMWLASDKAAYVSGSVLTVDGGLLAQA